MTKNERKLLKEVKEILKKNVEGYEYKDVLSLYKAYNILDEIV